MKKAAKITLGIVGGLFALASISVLLGGDEPAEPEAEPDASAAQEEPQNRQIEVLVVNEMDERLEVKVVSSKFADACNGRVDESGGFWADDSLTCERDAPAGDVDYYVSARSLTSDYFAVREVVCDTDDVVFEVQPDAIYYDERCRPDSDGDGIDDNDEREAGTDPHDPLDRE